MKRTIIFVLVLVLSAGILASKGTNDSQSLNSTIENPDRPWESFSDTPKTLSMYFDTNVAWYDNFDAWIFDEIARDTGVTLELQTAPSDTEEGLQLLVASNNYPDLLWLNWTKATTKEFLQNGLALSLSEIKDRFGLDFYPLVNESSAFFHKSTFGVDDLYGIPTYQIPQEKIDNNDPWIVKYQSGTSVNRNIYEEIGSPKINSMNDYIQMNLTVKQNYPDRLQYPIMVYRGTARDEFNLPPEIYLWKKFYDLAEPMLYNTDGQPFTFYFETPAFKEMVKDVNRMYNLELFNPLLWTATQGEEKWSLIRGGTAFTQVHADADNLDDETSLMNKRFPNESYMFLPTFSADPSKYSNKPVGTYGVGKHFVALPSENATAMAAAFMSYINSDVYRIKTQWLEIGKQSVMDSDGIPKFVPPYDKWSSTELNQEFGWNPYYGFLRDDYYPMILRQQNYPLMREALQILKPALENHINPLSSQFAVSATMLTGDALKVYSNIKEYFGDEITEIVKGSPANVEVQLEKVIAEVENLGLETMRQGFEKLVAEQKATIKKYWN